MAYHLEKTDSFFGLAETLHELAKLQRVESSLGRFYQVDDLFAPHNSLHMSMPEMSDDSIMSSISTIKSEYTEGESQ
jgi:hypothetical protein